MCINLSDDIKKCNWLPYKKEYELELNNIDGIKTIYSFFKDKAGNTTSKSITYNCETCTESFTASYNFDGTKSIDDINKEGYINIDKKNTYSWLIDTNNKYLSSINKGIDNSTSESIITIKPTANATLSFDYGVSSEANYDKLTISIMNENNTDVLVNSISGTKEDKVTNYNLEKDKTYKLILNYKKDNKGNVGKDIGYIKNIIIK